MAPKPTTNGPRGKRTKAQILEDRGHDNVDLTNVVLDLHDKRHVATLAKPTEEAHAAIKKAFEVYIARLDATKFPGLVLGDILAFGSPHPPIGAP